MGVMVKSTQAPPKIIFTMPGNLNPHGRLFLLPNTDECFLIAAQPLILKGVINPRCSLELLGGR